MNIKNMTISLKPEDEQFIQEKMKSGRYYCESEVISEALQLLQQRDYINKMRLEKLRQEVARGIEQLDRGEGVDGKEVFAQLREKNRQVRKSEKQA